MLKFLLRQENSDQQHTQQTERMPESALLAQAETSAVYLALTACFFGEYTSDGFNQNACGNKYDAPPTLSQLLRCNRLQVSV